MRPITPQVVTETLHLLTIEKNITRNEVENALHVGSERSREILSQLKEMSLIRQFDDYYTITDAGNNLFEAFIKEEHDIIDEILTSYQPYGLVKNRIECSPASKKELINESNLSSVSVDTIIRLLSWANNQLSLNRENGRYYFETQNTPSIEEFCTKLDQVYTDLCKPSYFGVKTLYIQISKIQEFVCEILGINKQIFKELLIQAYDDSYLDIELVGAPLLTLQKGADVFRIPQSNIPYYHIRISGENR